MNSAQPKLESNLGSADETLDALLNQAHADWKAEENIATRLTTRSNILLAAGIATAGFCIIGFRNALPMMMKSDPIVLLQSTVLNAGALICLCLSIAAALDIRAARTREAEKLQPTASWRLRIPKAIRVAPLSIDSSLAKQLCLALTTNATAHLKKRNARRHRVVEIGHMWFVFGAMAGLAGAVFAFAPSIWNHLKADWPSAPPSPIVEEQR